MLTRPPAAGLATHVSLSHTKSCGPRLEMMAIWPVEGDEAVMADNMEGRVRDG